MAHSEPDATAVTTPCIGICSTVFGDTVCRGCKRYASEIIHWNSYDNTARQLIDKRLQQHLLQILGDKFTVVNAALFEAQLHKHNIRFMRHRPPLCWVNDLLRTTLAETTSWAEFGLTLAPELKRLPINQLRELIDDELLLLSEAHHQRYMAAE